jgi:hypothetical protein
MRQSALDQYLIELVDQNAWIKGMRRMIADPGPHFTSDDFPGERLVACRNPVLAADRARTGEDLLAATEKLLAPITARVQAGRLTGVGPIGIEAGKVISKYKTGKHFAVTVTEDSLTVTRRQDQIDAEATLDGFHVLRTPVPAAELDGPCAWLASGWRVIAGRLPRRVRHGPG